MGYEVAPLSDGLPFGATVAGLTRDEIGDEAVRRALFDLWIDKGVLLFRGGDASPRMHVELSRCFGELEPHPFPESAEPDHSELVKIKYYPEDGTCYDLGGGEQRGGWLPWHSDLIYTDRINRGGILRPVQLPSQLGTTGFIDQIAAWERLPQALRDKIDGLQMVYGVDMDFSRQIFAHDGSVRCLRMAKSGTAIARRMWTYPRVLHPMVFTQAETGRKVLNVSPGFAEGIYEMGGPDGDALLREVLAYATEESGSYVHHWRQDDMVLWDNWRVLHCASGVPPEETRVMQRTTIKGDYALGRKLGSDARTDFDV